jgi:hypothetical protein
MENKKVYGVHPDVLNEVEKELDKGFLGNVGMLRDTYPNIRYMTGSGDNTITFFGRTGEITALVNYMNKGLPDGKKMEPKEAEKPY